MTPARLAVAGCAIGLALAAPPGLASQSQPDSIVIHSIYAGEPLLKLLTGVAAEVKGAFLPEEAERIHREAWGLAATSRDYNYPPRLTPWSYSYVVRGRDDGAKAVLAIRLRSTQPHLFDVSIGVPDAGLMKAIRAVAAKVGVDSLIPIDRIHLVLKEERGAHQPRLVLTLKTVRQFGCLGYYIDYDLHQDADTLHLYLHGVGAQPGPCPAMVGPAAMSRELRLSHRDYAVYVTHRERTDRLYFDITDSTTVVTGRDSTLVEADERPRLRYPRNSFAFRCGNGEPARALCHEVDTWLARQPGISRYAFPAGAINPYQPDPTGRTEEGITFFRYDTPSSYEYLRLCFGAIDNAIREAVGVNLSLEDWQGKYIAAHSQRALHERHIEVPERVTRLSACRTPSWRE